jgi:hypothetical protein
MMRQAMSRNTDRPVKTGKYSNPTPDGWVGWVEDKQGSWILFYKIDGSAVFYPKREKNGAVIGEGTATQVDSGGL